MCFKKIQNLSRNKKIILIVVIIFFIFALSAGAYYYYSINKNPLISKKENFGKADSSAKMQELVACPIDGVWTTAEKAFRHPLAVSIENHPDSRPQSSLNKASLIYETPTEGGITRFLAFYVENDSEKLGPVRSARTYFIDWLSEFDGIFSHCGGNADALNLINSENLKDLDEFTYPAIYWRTYDRYAPHNLYTKTENLWTKAKELGWDKKIDYQSWKYKDDIKKDKRPQNQSIDIYYANPLFRVKYDYNPANNSYLRSITGKPHIDKDTQKQLEPKNVAIIWVNTWPLNDPEHGWKIETLTSGPAKVFLDGGVISGTWKKDSKASRTKFYDNGGKEIVFNRGQTWIQVVPDGTQVEP